MKTVRRICALLLVIIMLLCTACGKEETPRRKKKVIVVRKPNSSQSEDISSEDDYLDDMESETEQYEDDVESETEQYEDDDSDDVFAETSSKEKRSLASKSTVVVEKVAPEYSVSQKNWDGPKEYKIIYPKGNLQLKHMALQLQNYFKTETGMSLAVLDDSATSGEKEILVGNTNRKKSKLKENEYAVTVSDGNLFFESGNFNGVVKAVKIFISLKYVSGKVNLLSGNYKFNSVMNRDSGQYKFVWGDDFDGNQLDPSHWNLTLQMDSLGQKSLVISSEKENICVEDGTLRISGTRAFDLKNKDVKYAAPYSVSTRYKMNFLYGYMELRARYPVKQGAWPSWWMTGKCDSGPAAIAYPSIDDLNNAGNILKTTFKAEVDILEYINCTPNIHKWYFEGGKHTDINVVRPCNSLSLTEEDSYVYHIFGFEWNPKEIKVYFDGELYQTIDITVSYDSEDDMNDFQNPMEMMFNNHVQPSVVPSDHSSFPFDYYIDYVRLYQKDGEGGLWVKDRNEGIGTIWSSD